MPRIEPVDAEKADAKANELLAAVQADCGMTPNIIRTLAHSPAALEAYLGFNKALGCGVLSGELREQIALAVAEVNGCDYCLAAHSAIGRSVGLSRDAIADSRRGVSPQRKVRAALAFARQMVQQRGWVRNGDLTQLRDAGYGDREIVEIVAHVAMSVFTNYFNHVAGTELDFPKVPELAGV